MTPGHDQETGIDPVCAAKDEFTARYGVGAQREHW
jgi:hypothetical protein